MASNLSMVFDILAIDRASEVFRRVGDSAGEAGAKVEASTTSVSNAGSKIAAGLGVAAAAAAVYSIKMAADFQSSTTRLVTSAGETESHLKMVQTGLLDMAGQVGYSVDDLSKAMYKVESGGQHGAAGLAVLKAAAQGAKTENADLTTVADAVTSAMQDYHLKASDAADVTSKLVAATASGKMTFQELAGSLSAILPVASANHVSLNDILGDLASMTVHGMSAEQASQNLADTVRHLAAPTAQSTKELAALGISATNVAANLGQKGLSGTLNEITDAIQKKLGPGSTQVVIDLNNALQMLPKPVQDFASHMLDGTRAVSDYRDEIKRLPPDQAAALQSFDTLITSTHQVGSETKSASQIYQSYSGALRLALGDATSMNTALMITGENTNTTTTAIQNVTKATADAKGNVRGWSDIQGTFNQQMAEAGAHVQAMAIQFGMHLLPALTDGMHFINDTALPGIEHLGGAVSDAAHWFSSLPGPVKDVAFALAGLRIVDMIGGFDKLSGSLQKFREQMAVQAALRDMNTAAGIAEGGVSRLGTAASMAAQRGLGALKAGAQGLMGMFGGPWGIAIAAAVGGIALVEAAVQKHDAEVKKATQDVQAWNKAIALGDGGKTAIDAQQHLEDLKNKLASVTEQINRYNAAAASGGARGGIGTLVQQQKDLRAELDKGTKAWEDQEASMTPVEVATERVNQAEHDLQMAMKDNAPNSQAVANAATRLSDARSRLAWQTGLANDAEKDHLKLLQEAAQQALSSVNSSLAAQQAQMQLTDAVAQYNQDAKDGQHSSAQLAEEQNSLAQQIIGTAQAAGQAAADQAKANGVTDTAQASNAAMLKSLQDNEKFLTGPAKDAVDQQIKILQGATIQTGDLADAVSKMGFTTAQTMGANTMVVKDATDDQIARFKQLGYTVNTLPDHQIVVSANTQEARDAITSLTNDYHNYSINVGLGGAGARYAAADGGVLPGYTPGRDVHLFTSPTAGQLHLSGGEAIMRPEFTSAMGAGWVHAMNAAARSGGAKGVQAAMKYGFAAGGVLPDWSLITKVGIDPASLNAAKHAMATAVAPGAPGNVSANAQLGQMMANAYGWGSGAEWNALYALWRRESGWNNNAQNPTSTAYGIPQFLDSTWGAMGYSKTSDSATQIAAGLKYISQRFGDPLRAWAHEVGAGWYEHGTPYVPRTGPAVLHQGERVLTAAENAHYNKAATVQGQVFNAPVTITDTDAMATRAFQHAQMASARFR